MLFKMLSLKALSFKILNCKIWFKDFSSVSCLLVKFGIATFLLFTHLTSFATYTEPTTKTNVNRVDPLFNEKIEDYKNFEQDLEEQKASAVKGVESNVSVDDLVDGGNTAAGISHLSNIRAEELEDAGVRKSVKEPWISEYLLDYSKPGMAQHKKDTETIADGTGKMLEGLIEILKRLDIDCKQVKGNKEVEPQYHIQLSSELERVKGDTVYNQVFCERLKNKYSCNDSLKLTCKKKGINWGAWQDREIHVPAAELFNFGKPVFWIDHTGKRCFEYKLIVERARLLYLNNAPDPDKVILWMREFLTTKHSGSTIENISDQMSSSWYGGIFSIDGWNYCGHIVGYKDHLWSTYVIKYQYRDGKPACLEWSEDWHEGCRLQ